MTDARFQGDLLGLLEGLDGCRRQIAHLVTGEETTEVQWSFAETVVLQPLAHPADTDLLVDVVAERFQVDVRRIEIGQQVGERFLTHITCRHEDVPQSCLMRQTRRVDHIFYIGEGFRVGVGYSWTTVLLTEIDQRLWLQLIIGHLFRFRL